MTKRIELPFYQIESGMAIMQDLIDTIFETDVDGIPFCGVCYHSISHHYTCEVLTCERWLREMKKEME